MRLLQDYYNKKWTAIYHGRHGVQQMPETKPMPKYLCHKEVRALKIREVERRNGAYWLTFVDDGYAPIQVTDAWIDRFGPTRNSYYVVYADGYASVSPAKAFEEGYVAVPG
jgi:hypothetical protein